MGPETLRRVLLLVSGILDRQPELETFDLSFFGGEPLLHYDGIVRPVLDHCRRECRRRGVRLLVGFTSNGYLIDDAMIAHLTEGDDRRAFRSRSTETARDTTKPASRQRGEGSYDTILANVRRLLGCGVEVILRINYTASNIPLGQGRTQRYRYHRCART